MEGLLFIYLFRQGSVLIASGQIPPHLQEGSGPWEPSKGQAEELLTLFLTKLKITSSINQTLHEASFNLQPPHLWTIILPATVMATAEAVPAKKTASEIRAEHPDQDKACTKIRSLPGQKRALLTAQASLLCSTYCIL